MSCNKIKILMDINNSDFIQKTSTNQAAFALITWVPLAITAGFFAGLGNVYLGVNCSKLGFWGATVQGPMFLALMVAHKLVNAVMNKWWTGHWINLSTSNLFSEDTVEQKPEEKHA